MAILSKIDGRMLSVSDGELEDNNLFRNFNDVYKITTLMKRAYEAGKAGESFEIEQVKGEW